MKIKKDDKQLSSVIPLLKLKSVGKIKSFITKIETVISVHLYL
ncbi:hypothetical protein CHCC14809_2224 [Bacillus licheniformis]|nr:hypothetical protein B4091_2086 [Bacillus licheniformis]TWK86658.1 hypothetical protein CHCC20333_3517 [Bacillus paralicheniformis]TWJ43077.1 hypothetical protein CHCC5025_3606 [Bacillus licheniformis]TWK39079.1 hypothetical protein CHCC20368_2626 [Bacillus licheniformis]TWL68797.1 hypothetical protein CHCC15318_1539 [Bacillus licheniformis]